MKHRGKSTERIYKALKKFERIHIDVITAGGIGANGYKNFVTFTDEFTRKVKTYFMKKKSETLEKF